MAILKELTTDDGNVGNYWRIIRFFISFDSGKIMAEIGLYKDKEAKQDGRKPMRIENFDCQVADLNGNIRQQIYDEAKKDARWLDGQDG